MDYAYRTTKKTFSGIFLNVFSTESKVCSKGKPLRMLTYSELWAEEIISTVLKYKADPFA